jgi:hypothetical protein
MDLYGFSLALGAAGLGVMALGGFSHGGHAGHASHGHTGHGHGGHAGASHAGASHTGASHTGASHAGAPHGQHPSDQGGGWAASLLSPRVLFSLLVGFGAAGLVALPLGEPWRAGAGILGAAGFETLLVGPIWRFLFRFESAPAATLDSSIEDEARAVSNFDRDGCGLVSVDVDGQIVQLLGTLSADDRARGVRIRSGDVLQVSSVDAARNRCVVRLTDR